MTIFHKNISDDFVWTLTNVYDPILSQLKPSFWVELLNLFNLGLDNWVVGGDFNVIRTHSDKNGCSFDLRQTGMFNDLVASCALLDNKGGNRRFSWARGGHSSHKALLDRVFLTTSWETHYSSVSSYYLYKVFSDHAPLVLDTSIIDFNYPFHFKFENYWLEIEGFHELVVNWWLEVCLGADKARWWQFKLGYLRRKLKR
jgi:hypothetical protein